MSYRQQGYRPQAPLPNEKVGGGNSAQDSNPQVETYRAPFIAQKNKKRKSRPFRLIVVLLVFALLSTIGVMGYRMYDEIDRVERANTFYPGVYIDGVQLYGHLPQDVFDYLAQKIRSDLSTFELEIWYEELVWAINRETLGMTDARIDSIVGTEINKAFSVGRDKSQSILDRYNTIVDLRTNPYEAYIVELDKDLSQIRGIIDNIREMVYRAPKDAELTIDFNRNNPLVFNPEAPGLDIDEEALRSTLERMVSAMESGAIQVPTKPVEPQVTEAALREQVGQMASVSTTINRRSTAERIKNVERGCGAFNALTVEPGKVISFNSLVGPRTAKNGFHEAEEIVSGEYRPGIGGGICQVSTTLYQAVIQAGLEVVERQNHGIPVNYTDKGSDATVADDRKDFKFKNNTDAPIYIMAEVINGKNGRTCEFRIYGRPDPNGYRYSMRHEEEEIPIPSKVERIWDQEQRYVKFTDQTHEVPGQLGYKVKTFVVVRAADGSFVEERHITTDTYQPVPNKLYTGVVRR